jgi:hypothetical protein
VTSDVSPAEPPLDRRALARLWAAASAAVVVLAGIVLATSTASSTVPAVLPAILTAAVSLGAVGAVVAVDRTFVSSPPADDAAAARELRTRAYGQLAILEAPVLLGVGLGFVLGPPWVVVVAAGGALAALVLTWPSRRRLGRFDDAWRAAGSDVSLLRAADG